MFRKEKMNGIANNEMLKLFYSTEYPMYKEELKRELDRDVKNNLERAMFY